LYDDIVIRHTYVLFYYVRICTHTIAHVISHDEEIVWNPYPSPVWPAGEDIRNPLAAQQRRRVQIARRRTPDRISLPHPQFTQSHGLSIHLSDGSTPLICDRWPSYAHLLQAFCGVVQRKNVQTIRPTHQKMALILGI